MGYLLYRPSPILAFLLFSAAVVAATYPHPVQSRYRDDAIPESYIPPRDALIQTDLSYLPAATRTERMLELRDGAVVEIDRRLTNLKGVSATESAKLEALKVVFAEQNSFSAVRAEMTALQQEYPAYIAAIAHSAGTLD